MSDSSEPIRSREDGRRVIDLSREELAAYNREVKRRQRAVAAAHAKNGLLPKPKEAFLITLALSVVDGVQRNPEFCEIVAELVEEHIGREHDPDFANLLRERCLRLLNGRGTPPPDGPDNDA